MKLAAHYNKASIIISLSVLIVGGLIYYNAIRYIATSQLDRDLTEEIDEVKDYINQHGQLPKQVDFDEDQTIFTQTSQTTIPRRFFDTTYYNDKEKRKEAGRAVEGLLTFNNVNYRVTISESKESTEYLIQLVLLITVLLAVILLAVLFITNRLILKGLWKPFYKLLLQLQAFDISKQTGMAINQTKVDEFNELNAVILQMTNKAKTDYHNVKSFTENASHEMMTPLAVVTSKLDTLIQDEGLNAKQLTQITNIYSYINRLSRLNQSLLLLVKIDNNLIKDEELIDLKVTLTDKIQQFTELIQGKNLKLTARIEDKSIYASKHLVDILLNNLFSNAIKHNYDGGEIDIELAYNELIVKNTGEKIPLVHENLFSRFHKGKQSEGTGLGLTLVKNICDHHKYRLSYHYFNDKHEIIITF